MKEPWQAYLRLGIVHFMAYPECLGGDGPLLESLATLCHDPFFDAIDVGPMNDPLQRQECAKLLRASQVEVTFACQPVQLRLGLDINAADKVERQKSLETVAAHFEQARELGATKIALLSGKNVPSEQRPAAMDALISSLCRLSALAKERAGLPLMLEIFDHDVDKKALVGTCALAAQLAKAVRREFPDFGLLHDLSHIYLCHEKPAQHLPLIREYLTGIHLGNSVLDRNHPLFGDTHPHFGLAGTDNDTPQLRDFVKTLFDIGYLRAGRRPICGFEVKPPAGISAQTAIANMKRTWQHAWWSL